MKIATYNVNSINARIENLINWLKKEEPDIVLLQEIKCDFNSFPFFVLQAVGYEAKILGQKSYNGVAILSRHKIKILYENLPEFNDDNSRYLEADVVVDGKEYRVASIYLPNGNPPYNNPDDESKWFYKLKWMEAFYNHAQKLLELRKPIILGGDFNVIMTDNDVYNPEEYRNNALFRPEVIQRLKAFEYLGFYDAYRVKHKKDAGYTFWDYAGGALQNDMGMRIDYLWLNSYAVDLLDKTEVDKSTRVDVKPSDHTVLKAVLK